MSYGKDELFATHDAVESNRSKYIKTFAIAAIIGAAIVALVVYLSGAKTGDAVKAPEGLQEAVNTYLLKNEKLETNEIKTYQCVGAYAVEAWVTPANNSTAGKVKRNVFAIGTGEPPTWEIRTVGEIDPSGMPCGPYR
jgi:hypothetical protein